MEDYYDAKIDHNRSNFHMIWKKVKENRRALRTSINLFNKAKFSYSSANYIFIGNVAGAEMRQINDKKDS